VSDPDPPAVGSTITVSYSLTNDGNDSVQLDRAFVGARNATRAHHDSKGMHQGRTLAPGETIDVQDEIRTDSAGTWQLWPCYELTDGEVCPDERQAFPRHRALTPEKPSTALTDTEEQRRPALLALGLP
jgi:hypothetical protein